MPTGPSHYRTKVNGPTVAEIEIFDCRCMIGTDHGEDGETFDEPSSDDSLSVYDAADIWLSNGQDEDYTFGYTEDELRRAAGMG